MLIENTKVLEKMGNFELLSQAQGVTQHNCLFWSGWPLYFFKVIWEFCSKRHFFVRRKFGLRDSILGKDKGPSAVFVVGCVDICI